MTTIEATPTTPATPMIVPCPPGGSSCATCGLVVVHPDPRTITRLLSMGRIPAPGQPHVQSMDQAVQVEFARCTTCQAIHDRAAELLDEHPRVERMLGSRHHAVQKVESALVALDLLGSSADWIVSDSMLLLAIEHLSTPGSLAMWSRRFVPFVMPSVAFDTAVTARFADVSPEVRALAREGMAAVLRHRVDRPIDVPCPPNDDGSAGGCLICGVSAVTVLASRRDEAWTRVLTKAGQIGGKPGLREIDGCLCPDCWRSVEASGSLGHTAIARALIDHLDPSGRLARSLAVPQETMTVPAWAVVIPRPAPSSERFAFLDLDDLRRSLGLAPTE